MSERMEWFRFQLYGGCYCTMTFTNWPVTQASIELLQKYLAIAAEAVGSLDPAADLAPDASPPAPPAVATEGEGGTE